MMDGASRVILMDRPEDGEYDISMPNMVRGLGSVHCGFVGEAINIHLLTEVPLPFSL